MTEKVCLVTGANAGIGKATTLGLAQMGATVIMVCRSPQRGQEAQSDIRAATSNKNIDLLVADLASPNDIRKLAATVKATYGVLHVLINNAATIPRQRTVTAEGWEMQWMVNHLAPFLLTNLLLDLLQQSAPARVVTVASQVHTNGRINFNDLQSTKNYRPASVYANTKLANVLFTFELARRLAGSGVTANCLHPGVVATNLSDDYMGMPRQRQDRGILSTRGAETSLHLATSPEVEGVSGEYFVNKGVTRATAVAYDETLAAQLWQVSAEMTGLA